MSYGVWLWEKHLARELGLRTDTHSRLTSSRIARKFDEYGDPIN